MQANGGLFKGKFRATHPNYPKKRIKQTIVLDWLVNFVVYRFSLTPALS